MTSLCKSDFRFEKSHILRLRVALEIPDFMKMSEGSIFERLEGLRVLLKRMAYPNRLLNLRKTFGRSISELSMMFNTMLNFINEKFGFLLTSMEQWWLEPGHLVRYATAILAKGSPLDLCCGFIDGTLNAICRPTVNQKECHSGHKRTHGLKYQSIMLPNGIIANLYGPIPGRRHDTHMLRESAITEAWQAKLHRMNCPKYYFYGDSGYPLEATILTPYLGNMVSVDQHSFNKNMSSLRVCVEWEFGKLMKEFAFLDFKKNQKLLLQSVAKQFQVGVILNNCHTCLYGSQTSTYFGIDPPRIENYLSNTDSV